MGRRGVDDKGCLYLAEHRGPGVNPNRVKCLGGQAQMGSQVKQRVLEAGHEVATNVVKGAR
jgi:hypothetical protein